jgi:2,3-diketo-5-methylthio-1-phosphopentane phosphatase
MSCHVFVDFDGTIVPQDATNELLAQFAEPEWLVIEDEWQAGHIGSRECMERQVDLLRMTPEQFENFVGSVEIDPAFPAFVDLCRANGAEVTVVSDGLDRVVESVLQKAGLELPVFANRMEWRGGDRWRLRFPHARHGCRVLMGNCKCSHAQGPATTVRIMVGDGRSDFCIAEQAHFVLAKGRLAEHCRELDLPHAVFERFGQAKSMLGRWFRTRAEERELRIAGEACNEQA